MYVGLQAITFFTPWAGGACCARTPWAPRRTAGVFFFFSRYNKRKYTPENGTKHAFCRHLFTQPKRLLPYYSTITLFVRKGRVATKGLNVGHNCLNFFSSAAKSVAHPISGDDRSSGNEEQSCQVYFFNCQNHGAKK